MVAGDRRNDSRLPALSAPEFVGRGHELNALAEALDHAPAVVLIEGEAGIGKTRLLREFLASQEKRGRRALTGACLELRVPYTLGAVVDAVREGVDDNVAGLRLSGLAGALRPLFPEWAGELPPAPEPLEDATAARHRLFRAFTEVLDRLDVAVLALEDVHWADEATLEFLLFLVSRRPQPVSLVLTFRRDEVPSASLLLRLSSRLPPDAHLVRLAPGPLDAGQTASFVSSMLTGGYVSEEFADFLHARTEGVPLAVEESVRLMHDRADLIRREDGWARRRLDRIEVPPTIRDAVLERVQRLDADTRTVLYAAAVLSGPADQATLLALTGLPEERFAARSAEALGSGLLREVRAGQWSFRHPLACYAVYDAIPAADRRALHLRAARALERWPVPPAAQLARHFTLAGDAGAAQRYTEEAADLCLQSGDVATSALLIHSLVTTVPLPATVLIRLMTKIQFQALSGSDPYVALVEALRSALSGQVLTPVEQAFLRFQTGRVLMAAGQIEDGRREVLLAVGGLPPGSTEMGRARILLALPMGTARPVPESLRWLREAPPPAPSIAAPDRLSLSTDHAVALLSLGEEAGWAAVREVPDDVTDPRAVSIITIAHQNIAEEAVKWGRYEVAAAHFEKARVLAERHLLLEYLDTIAISRAPLDWFTGNWKGLAERTACLIAEDSGMRLKDRCEAALVAGRLQAAAGDRAVARERLRFAGRDDQQRVAAQAALARLCLDEGDVDEALRLTGRLDGIVTGGLWTRSAEFVPVRAAALVAAGRFGAASELVNALGIALGEVDAPAPQASLAVCRAVLAEAGGRLGEAAGLFARAAGAWEALPRPYDALLARERAARCLLADGRDEAARAALGEVARGLAELGARNDAERIGRFLDGRGAGEAGAVTRGRGRPGYGNRLSPRELEVARLLVEGLTNRQIADALVVSVQTIASQVKSAMRKLDVTSRTALAVKVVESGLVGPPESTPPRDE